MVRSQPKRTQVTIMFAKTSVAVATFALCAFAAENALADTFHVTVEAPGVQSSTSTFTTKGVETFDTRATGDNQTFSTHYGLAPGQITGYYTNVDVLPADAYGGAGNVGNYGVTFNPETYSLALVGAQPINYFGFWLSALDRGNVVTFSKDGQTVFTFSPDDVVAATQGNTAYNSNPNFAVDTVNPAEPYVFVNFYDTTGTFDTVTFHQSAVGAGYESDNHTVGFYTKESGTTVTAVPEPSTYAMLVAGLAGIGFMVRRRKV
jgi:PEP-CTERM motif